MILAVIAQLKFVATYLVPSLYPAMITLLGSIIGIVLAAFGPPPPGSVEPWLLNLFALIGVLTLLATFALVLKKLFGRQPSLTEILSGLVSVKTLAEYKEEIRLRTVGLEKQISDARHSFDERANSDLVRIEKTFREIFRRGEERDRAVASLSREMATLTERTENHLRKLDQYDQKLDNLLRDVTRAAAAGVRQGQQGN
jgi:hypothetical protein